MNFANEAAALFGRVAVLFVVEAVCGTVRSLVILGLRTLHRIQCERVAASSPVAACIRFPRYTRTLQEPAFVTTAASSSTSPKSARVPEYDVARVASIALVVLIHVIAPYVLPEARELGGAGPIGLLSRELRFAVPMFVLLTGALLWSRPRGGAPSWREFFSRRLTVVLVPYLAWSTIFIAVGARLGIKPLGSLAAIARDVILGTTWYHLYFVPIIVGVYLCTPVAHALFRRSIPALLVVATAVGLLVPVAITRAGLQGSLLFAFVSLVALFLPYAAVGAWYASARASESRLIARTWPALLIVGLALRAWYTYLPAPISSAYANAALNIAMNVLPSLGVLGLALFAVERLPRLAPAAATWAVCVFGVYLSHPFVLLAIERAMKYAGVAQPRFIPWTLVVWPAVTVGCFLGIRALSRFGWLWWLHGVPARRTPGPETGIIKPTSAEESVR